MKLETQRQSRAGQILDIIGQAIKQRMSKVEFVFEFVSESTLDYINQFKLSGKKFLDQTQEVCSSLRLVVIEMVPREKKRADG
jgi:hypothetical protein